MAAVIDAAHPFGVPTRQEIADTADRLKQARMAIEPNAAVFARRAGLTPHRYNQYEKGRRPLTIDAAMRLSKTYGISLDWLFRGDPAFMPLSLIQRISQGQANP